MNRREFLLVSTTAAAAAGCSETRRRAAESAAANGPSAFELDEVTIDQLQQRMDSGELTARSIAEKYLGRIEEIDKTGPAVNAIIEINPEALAIADSLDAERAQNGPRGPMHGIPVLIKDNIDTADQMQTTAGSLALEGSIAPQDSAVAAALRKAGAVILAKTNLSEWANFRSDDSTSGWSGRGGLTRNPYALSRNPCGSSSGSGAGVSANLGAVAIGTETNGSIVCPSSINGIVGIKPTLGLISRAGIIPIAHTQDTAGPMCRAVRDAAVLLGALAAVDPRDEATAAAEGNLHADYTQFLDPAGLKGARLGVGRQYFGQRPDVDAVAEENLAALRAAGAELVDIEDLSERSAFGNSQYQVLLYEFKTGLNRYLAGLDLKVAVRTLAAVIEFNEKHADREMPFFGQNVLIEAEQKGPLTEPAYLKALELMKRLSQAEGIDRVVEKYKIDAIVAPSAGPAWMTDLINGDNGSGGSAGLAAMAGYPHITVPGGFIRGLPVGFSFFGPAWSEPTLLKLAYAFEQQTQHRKAPQYLPTLDLA